MMIGTRIDHYEVVGKIGEGGMGTVYRAVDALLERDVALKFLRPDLAAQPELVERFRSEAITLAKLNHPNIATLYGMARHGGDLFMIMEYVPGETLDALVRRSGRLDPFQAAGLGVDLLKALEYAHRAGVIHRDIKPANLILTPGGDIKVTDFGIARVFGAARQTKLGFVVGTLAYMAPELIMPERFGGQEPDGRVDLYATGIVLYEMLTGRVPFDAPSDYALMRAQVEDPPPSPRTIATVPEALEVVVLQALAKAPTERFTSATQFREALLRAEETIAKDTPRPTRLAKPLPETRWAGAAPHSQQVSTDVNRLGRATPHGMNWKHYTSLAALAMIAASLVAARLLRTPSPQPETASQAAPSMPAAQMPLTTAAPLVRPPAELAAPQKPVVPPDTPAPEIPPLKPRPRAPRPVDSAARPPADPNVTVPAPEAPVIPPQPVEIAAPPAAPSSPEPAASPGPSEKSVPPLTYEKVKLLVIEGEKARELEARLTLEADRLTIRDHARGSVLKEFRYASIRGAVYSQSKHPRWKTSLGATAAVGVLAAPLFFLKSTKHWFTLQTEEDFAVLQLDKNNYRLILPAFETRSRITVERQTDQK